MYINATDLIYNSDKREFQGLLPKIIRKLIRSTTKGISKIEFRSEEGIQVPGFDGIVEVTTGNEFVADGKSVWEISTQSSVTTKANLDYEKRKGNPLGETPSDVTYMCVTSRRWSGKEKWVQEKKMDNFWKDVRAIDVDNLIDWLETSPADHIWISIILGKYSENAVDLGRYWNELSHATDPNLTPNLLLAGRESILLEFTEKIAQQSTIAIKTNTQQESIALIAALIQKTSEDDTLNKLSQTIIVRDKITWNRLVYSRNPLILVPTFDDLVAVSSAIQNGHIVILPKGKNDASIENEINVPELSVQKTSDILKSLGVPINDASSLAILAKRDFIAFRRAVSIIKEKWAPKGLSTDGHELVPLLLLGSWDESYQGDQEIVRKIAQEEYTEYLQSINQILNKPGTIVNRFGNFIQTSERSQILSQSLDIINKGKASIFRDLVAEVLGTADPKYDLPIEQQWMAVAHGAIPKYSGLLRQNITETLAILSVNSETMPYIGTFSTNTFVSSALERVYKKILGDGKCWASIWNILPLLAEADPDLFLKALDNELKINQEMIKSLFIDFSDPTFTTSPHVGLVWALETLSWNVDYLSYSTSLLVKLAELDPDGNTTTRPINSLESIYNIIFPQTDASIEQRFDIIDLMIESNPDIAWKLLIKISPDKVSRFISTTKKPKWRKWTQEEILGASSEDIRKGINSTIYRLLNLANNEHRIAQLLNIISNIPESEYELVLDFLEKIDKGSFENSVIIWNKLREFISRHREFPDAKWSLKEEKLSRLEKIYYKFEPDELRLKYSWLFSETASLIDGVQRGRQEYFDLLNELRVEGLSNIYKNEGFESILSLIDEVDSPRTIGFSLSQINLTEEELTTLLVDYLGSGSNQKLDFINRYLYGVSTISSKEELYSLFESSKKGLSQIQQGHLLTILPLETDSWSYIQKQGLEIEREYWHRVNAFAIQDHLEAVKKLIEFDKPNTAIELLAFRLKPEFPFDSNIALEALEKGLKIPIEYDMPLPSFSYHASSLFSRLENTSGIDLIRLAQLEWQYLPVISRHKESDTFLHHELTRNPQLFAEILTLVYKAKDEERHELSDTDEERAFRAHRLLSSWKSIPGSTTEGVDENVLFEWIAKARHINETNKRVEIGDQEIGTMLSNSPPDNNGNWPHPSVCQVIEKLANENIEIGFEIGLFNNRGVISKGPLEGGEKENEIAEFYSKNAQFYRDKYPRTSATLRKISDQYREYAKQEDRELDKRFFTHYL